ncbi:MAG: diaminopimelate epimerase [Bacteroidales bacterium]|nr:diaminopimelate epimerase [Bacteroidales bacterium]
MMKFYKYQGAGNDFLIADNRDGSISLTKDQIASVCDRRYGVGADGLMLLETSDRHDFRMTYYNSDGSGGMMCGNGGRCIVAFAADMGLEKFDFDAADGFHTARILKDEDGVKTVRLKMKDVSEICRYEALEGVSVPSEGYFLDTGTRHYVRFVKGLKEYDIVSEGREIRYDAVQLQPVGVNVNFVEPSDGILNVRTYEKGVEDETYACGTGIVASCIAAYEAGVRPSDVDQDGRVHYDVHAKKDVLAVDFLPSEVAEDVWLTGPASFVAEILIK